MKRPGFASIDDYLAAQPSPARAVLRQVRATLRKALPGVTEGISYQIPVYKLDGVMATARGKRGESLRRYFCSGGGFRTPDPAVNSRLLCH